MLLFDRQDKRSSCMKYVLLQTGFLVHWEHFQCDNTGAALIFIDKAAHLAIMELFTGPLWWVAAHAVSRQQHLRSSLSVLLSCLL